MSTFADPFLLINQELQEQEQQQVQAPVEQYIEAYQIIRLRKMTIGGISKRDIIDTIYVEHCNPELALKKANYKAQLLGNCMVIEKSERVITSY